MPARRSPKSFIDQSIDTGKSASVYECWWFRSAKKPLLGEVPPGWGRVRNVTGQVDEMPAIRSWRICGICRTGYLRDGAKTSRHTVTISPDPLGRITGSRKLYCCQLKSRGPEHYRYGDLAEVCAVPCRDSGSLPTSTRHLRAGLWIVASLRDWSRRLDTLLWFQPGLRSVGPVRQAPTASRGRQGRLSGRRAVDL